MSIDNKFKKMLKNLDIRLDSLASSYATSINLNILLDMSAKLKFKCATFCHITFQYHVKI